MSQLWWQVLQYPDRQATPLYPITNQPIFQLMSGSSFPAPIGVVNLLIANSWAGEGGPPELYGYDYGTSNPPQNSAVIRNFFGVGIYSDTSPDGAGFTTSSLMCIDFDNAYFTPSYSIGFSNSGSNYGLNLRSFPSQAYGTDIKLGPINVSGTPVAILSTGIVTASFEFNSIESDSYSGQRHGLAINAVTSSPQIALDPVASDPSTIFPGDIWFTSASIDGNSHLFVGDYSPFSASIKSEVVTVRLNETTQSVINRFGTSDKPTGSILAVNSVAVDGWFISVNSAGNSGSGWRNATWGGGIYMPESGTVGVFGTGKSFIVPSGSASINQSLLIQSGGIQINNGTVFMRSSSLIINTGSILLNSVSSSFTISGSNAQLLVSGNSADARLRGIPIVAVQISNVNSSSLSNVRNGTIYINSGTVPEEISFRLNNSWTNFTIISPGLIDDGTF